MTDITTEPQTPEAPAAVTPVVAPKPEAPKAPAVAFSDEQKAEMNRIITERVSRAQVTAAESAEKTVEERIAAIEQAHAEQLKSAEQNIISSIVARGVAGTHNPAVAASIVLAQLGDTKADDEDAILAACVSVLTDNPYLVKADGAAAPAPVLTPAPGVAQSGADKTFMSAAELDKVTAEELAADPELMKRYLSSLNG